MLTTHAGLIDLEEAKWNRTINTSRLFNEIDGLRSEIDEAIGLGLLPAAQVASPSVVINEIHYNPAEGGVEFVELFNPGPVAVDISGWEIPAADLVAPAGTVILPEDYVVFTENQGAFATLYGGGIFLGGQYGGGFSGKGELVELFDADGVLIDLVDYDDADPWATTPDGDGPSLELIDPGIDNSLPNAWFPSSVFGGSPGEVNDPDTEGGPPPPPPPPPPEDVDFVVLGSEWSYLDDGSDQGTVWRASGFDDSSWATGPAQLGYGDGDEATVINGGPSGNRFITSYFRRDFSVVDAAKVLAVEGRVVRDDGAVVYVNGTEVFRTNMPGGAVNHLTVASTTVGGSAESLPVAFTVSPALLTTGLNTVAVEVHQRGSGSSDVSFDLDLVGSAVAGEPDTEAPSSPDPVVVSPTGPSTMDVSWMTSTDDSGVVGYEVRRDGVLVATTGSTLFNDFGLTPDTSYEYVVTAKDPSGNSTVSAPVSNSTDPDGTPPSDPSGLVAVGAGSSTINVSWNASVDDVGPVTYTVWRDDVFAATTASTSVAIMGLDPETTYGFKVQAVDGAGNMSAVVGPVDGTTGPEVVDPVLVEHESVWRFLDDGSNQGTAWRELGFNDSGWATGQAELGYGDGDEVTVIYHVVFPSRVHCGSGEYRCVGVDVET
jgi:chitodextrinase